MKWFWTIVIALACLVIEVGLVSNVRDLVGGPDLLLLFVVFLSLYGPVDDAPIAGWLIGLAKDSLSAGPFGLYAVLFMTLAFFLSRMRADIFLEYNVSHAVNAAVSTAVIYAASGVWRLVAGLSVPHMTFNVLTVSLWNAALAPFAFHLLFKFARRLDTARRPG